MWERHPARWNPVWPHEAGEGLGEVPIPFWDPIRREYIAMTRIWTGPRPKAHERCWDAERGEYRRPTFGNKRMIGRGTSPDGIFWAGPVIIYNCDGLDPLGAQPYQLAAWPYADRHLGLVTHMQDERQDDSIKCMVHLHMMWSTDGCYTWRRHHDRDQQFIPLGDPYDFDGGMISQPTRMIEVGDEWWCYYCGHTNRHGPGAPEDAEKLGGISLATMPKGRLFSMAPTGDTGMAESKKLEPGFGEFWVNADGSTGAIRVTIIDGDTDAPEGQSDPITSDDLRTRVTWNGTPWTNWSEKKIRVKIDFERGSRLWEIGWGK